MHDESPCKFCREKVCTKLCEPAEEWFKRIEPSLPRMTNGQNWQMLLLADMRTNAEKGSSNEEVLSDKLVKRGKEITELKEATNDRIGTNALAEELISKIKRNLLQIQYPFTNRPKPKERQWLLAFLECKRCSEIAKIAGCTGEWVRAKITMEMKRLREFIEDDKEPKLRMTKNIKSIRDLKMGDSIERIS